jgi:hypothetical protein
LDDLILRRLESTILKGTCENRDLAGKSISRRKSVIHFEILLKEKLSSICENHKKTQK